MLYFILVNMNHFCLSILLGTTFIFLVTTFIFHFRKSFFLSFFLFTTFILLVTTPIFLITTFIFLYTKYFQLSFFLFTTLISSTRRIFSSSGSLFSYYFRFDFLRVQNIGDESNDKLRETSLILACPRFDAIDSTQGKLCT